MIPPLADRVEAWLSRFASRAGVAGGGGDGFWSGTAVGASLGIVYAPCAGPILAGVIAVSASQPFTAGRLAVALSYGLGSAFVLYFLMLGGRRLAAPLARRGGALQVAMGAVMVVVALAMFGNYDIRFQNRIASSLPGFLVNPTEGLEDSRRPRPPWMTCAANRPTVLGRGGQHAGAAAAASGGRIRPSGARQRPRIHRQPAVVQHPGRPAADPELATRPRHPGRLLDLQLHQLPAHAALPDRLGRALPQDGLTIVGVHSPEFPFEKDAGNVEEAIERNGIDYPVAQDNDLATWSAYGNQYWPAEYFIDARGESATRISARASTARRSRSSASFWPKLAEGPGRG